MSGEGLLADRPAPAVSGDELAERNACLTVLADLRQRLSLLAGLDAGQGDGLVEAPAVRIECHRIDAAMSGIEQGLHRNDPDHLDGSDGPEVED